MTTARQKKLALLAWIAVCLIWGTTYLGIRISLESIPRTDGRLALDDCRRTAGAVRARPCTTATSSRWGGIALMGFLMLGLGNGGVVFAEQWVPSGLAAVLVATSPFWMAAVEASLRDGERLRANTIAGLIVGFAGILVLVWPTTVGHADRRFLAGVIALQIASFGWALGSAHSRRHARNDHILGTTALQMLAGGLMMPSRVSSAVSSSSSFSPRGRRPHWCISRRSAPSVDSSRYTYALRHLAVSFVSLYAYINPVIAVALGVLLMGEPSDRRMATAAALVFAGVAIVRWKSTQPALETVVSPQGKGSRQPAGRRPYCAGVLSVRGRARRSWCLRTRPHIDAGNPAQKAHLAAQPRDERLDHDLITRVDRTPIANALDAHEVNQLLAVLGLRQIMIAPTCATASVRIVGGRAGSVLAAGGQGAARSA